MLTRSLFVAAFSIAVHSLAFAQDGAFDDSAHTPFPQTATLRSRIAAVDTSRSELAAAVRAIDSVRAIADSIAQLEHPWDAAHIARTWTDRFPMPADSALRAWLARATPLADSNAALRRADVQRKAVRVDSVHGVIDLAPAAAQRVLRVRIADGSARFVQFDKPHKMGDTVGACIALFGRKIFISRTSPTGWEMIEGATPPVGSDSVFDVLREVGRPRAYDVYDRLALRFDSLQSREAPRCIASWDAFRAGLRAASDALQGRVAVLDGESHALCRELWKAEALLTAEALLAHDRALSAVATLERLLTADSLYKGAAWAMSRARHAVDSATRAEWFGADGRANMELIPSGEVRLRSGERFRPEPFFVDRAPVSVDLFARFEAATGYRSRGRHRRRASDEPDAREPVADLAAEDKLAFAQWCGKRAASPQEVEYVIASGFETLARRLEHRETPNAYHVDEHLDGFYCVVEIRRLEASDREAMEREARVRERAVRTIIDAIH